MLGMKGGFGEMKNTFQYISDTERNYNDELFDPVDLAYYTMEGISSEESNTNTLKWFCDNAYGSSGRPGTMEDISRPKLPYSARNKLNHGFLKKNFQEVERRSRIDHDRW